ncbi:hypothetical protein [Chelativorans sp.]|uniref:hypothetical protein n=1 Tax=Chelativorans sp. TaxID=2203393 RepID=UPI0028126DBD|nr:hypothetical protein [Chelativorans sp.]
MRGRALKLSVPRRLVGDLMRFSINVPRVAVQRQMNLRPLVEARASLSPRPSWTAIFLRGYALLAQDVPELRRAYVKFPWPHLYEYPMSVASIAHEREYEGERAVLLSLIKGPERHSLQQLNASLQTARTRSVLEVKEFRRALRLARMPLPVRWLLMWFGLNIGRQRANYFGTFQLSVYSGLGADSLNPLTPLTTLLNYGPIGEDGRVNVRIHYDHRVMDGADIARALERFENILNGIVAEELSKDAGTPASPVLQESRLR